LAQLATADEMVKVPGVGERPARDLSRQALAEVVEPRYEELFTLIQAELRRSGFEDLVAAGIVLTGGTSKMEGAVELAEEIFHMPVRLAKPHGVKGMEDYLNSPIFATGMGLLQYAQQDHVAEGNGEFEPVKAESSQKVSVLEKMKAWFQGNF